MEETKNFDLGRDQEQEEKSSIDFQPDLFYSYPQLEMVRSITHCMFGIGISLHTPCKTAIPGNR